MDPPQLSYGTVRYPTDSGEVNEGSDLLSVICYVLEEQNRTHPRDRT